MALSRGVTRATCSQSTKEKMAAIHMWHRQVGVTRTTRTQSTKKRMAATHTWHCHVG